MGKLNGGEQINEVQKEHKVLSYFKMSYSLEEKVEWLAVTSRVFILGLQFVFNTVIPDHEAGVFKKPPSDDNVTETFLDTWIKSGFGGLSNWDAQYFLHIAQYGYTYENTLAFFPFFPLVLRHFSQLILYIINHVVGYLLSITNLISVHSSLLIASTLLNNLLFVKTAKIFFKLSLTVLKNEKLSYISAVLFCVNPASIFFSACYSESLYSFLVFYGMLQIELNNFFLGSIVTGLSGLTRSNGLINIGFICYGYLRLKIDRKLPWFNNLIFSICVIVSILPFSLYQLYCYLKYCFPGNTSFPKFIRTYAIQNNYKTPGSDSPWCHKSIPFAYSYVQSHYWNVGFLQYYELKQIPNFLLALPVFALVFSGVFHFVSLHKTSLLYLGFGKHSRATAFPLSTYAYVVHCLALSIFAALFIHIQVSTRMLFSSSPVPYWFSAWFAAASVKGMDDLFAKKFVKKSHENFIECYANKKSKWKTFLFTDSLHGSALWIKYYYIAYFVVGTLMFSNHLPWT